MRKLGIIAGIVLLGAVAFAVSLALAVNAGGGLSSSWTSLSELPLVGKILKVQAAETDPTGPGTSALAGVADELGPQQAAMKERQIAITRNEQENLKKTAEILEKMDSAPAAEVLTEMYSNGQIGTVAKIVYLMQDRGAAKVLAAIEPAQVRAEIIEQLSHVEEQAGEGL